MCIRDRCKGDPQLNEAQAAIAEVTNLERRTGTLAEMMVGADVFIGVSAPKVVTPEMVGTMAKAVSYTHLSEPAVIGQPGAPRWGLRAFFSGQRGRNVVRSPFFRQRCLGQQRQKRRTQKRRGCKSLRFASFIPLPSLGRTPGITSF